MKVPSKNFGIQNSATAFFNFSLYTKSLALKVEPSILNLFLNSYVKFKIYLISNRYLMLTNLKIGARLQSDEIGSLDNKPIITIRPSTARQSKFCLK